MNLNKNDLEYWENILETEGLWDLDQKEWFSDKIENILKFRDKNWFEKFILDFEEKNNLKVEIKDEDSSVYFIDKDSNRLIWFVRPGHYSYNWLEKSEHLEKVIEPDFRWKWFWRVLIEIFLNYWKINNFKNFSLPKKEYSHKLSSISLFVKYFWYEITWKFIDWEKVEVDEYEFDRIFLRNVEDLDFTYEITKTRNV